MNFKGRNNNNHKILKMKKTYCNRLNKLHKINLNSSDNMLYATFYINIIIL